MASEILHVVIDERNRLSPIEAETLVVTRRILAVGRKTQRRVFKDYILSAEPFHVETI